MIGMNENFVISGFSDEIDASTDIQFENLNRLGISYFEPRNIDGKNIATSMVDGFWDALNSLFTMILVTAAVKGSNAFLSKAMGL